MKSREPRWWPLIAVGILYAAGLLWAWQIWAAPSRQGQVLATMAMTFLMIVGVLLWLLLLSRLPWKTRLLGLLGIAIAGVLLSKAVEIRGVYGDLIPILAWKWSPRAHEMLDRNLPTGQGDPSAGVPVPETTILDFPQFLGPNRNATLEGISLERNWEQTPPDLVWRQPVGAGWAGFAVVGDCAITLEQRGPEEMTICYDLDTGAVRWSHSDTTQFVDVVAGEGPRSTPTIIGGRVFSQGATGMLNLLDLGTGVPVWAVDIAKDNSTGVPLYGFAASPLIHRDNVVVVAPGAPQGSLVAYDRETGEKRWNAGDDQGRYSSPTLLTLLGREQILLFNRGALRGHDPGTGEVMWEFPWPTETEVTSQPLALSENRVFLSSGYGIGSKVIELAVDTTDKWSAELVWESTSLKAKFTNVVVHEGSIYGLDDGILTAIDPQTGERHWKRGRFGHGHVLLVDKLLVVLSEKGEVVLVDPQPDEYVELGRFQAIEGKTWNPPALAGSNLLIRNATEAACYRLPLVR